MKFINSDINTFSKEAEDTSMSEGEVAKSDQDTTAAASEGATEAASEGAAASSAKPGGDVERGRKPERKLLPTIKIKLTTNTGGASSGSKPSGSNPSGSKPSASGPSGSRPSASDDSLPLEQGYLVWAPITWRKDLKPMIRYMVEGPDNITRIKYLSWDQSKGEELRQTGRPGDFLNSIGYLLSEPLVLRGGDWNHATICFFEFHDDGKGEDAEAEVIHEVSQYERIELPTMSQEAIWAEKPCVEWTGLRFEDVNLREILGPGIHENRGRLRVVTHEAIGDGEIEMVMKIWPTPMCSKLGLENEMMAYRACDGQDITPEFLAHVTEAGRHISMLTAYHSDAHKPQNNEEKELCRTALHTLQIKTGWQRNPKANERDNYLIEDEKVLLIDLASVCTPEMVARRGGDWMQKVLDEDFDEYWEKPMIDWESQESDSVEGQGDDLG